MFRIRKWVQVAPFFWQLASYMDTRVSPLQFLFCVAVNRNQSVYTVNKKFEHTWTVDGNILLFSIITCQGLCSSKILPFPFATIGISFLSSVSDLNSSISNLFQIKLAHLHGSTTQLNSSLFGPGPDSGYLGCLIHIVSPWFYLKGS